MGSPAVLADVLRVAVAAWPLDRARRREGPKSLLARLRRRGSRARRREAAARAQLQAIIARVDRWFPGGPNCYRRVLLEMALDAGAASQPVRFGLNLPALPGSGHAAFAGAPDEPRVRTPAEPPQPGRYDVVFDV